MNLVEVKALESEELKLYGSLRDNIIAENGSFIADSPKVIDLILEKDIEVTSILATKEFYETREEILQGKKGKFFVASKALLESIVGHKIHHNAMLCGKRPKEKSIDELGDNIVLVDEISSTENIGSICRSAAGVGVDSLLLSKRSPHPFGRRALRVSMGYASFLNYAIYENPQETIRDLKNRGYTIYGAELTKDAKFLQEVKPSKKWVIVLGHEGKGLSEELIELCDEIVAIEMAEGVKSYNVGVAAAIMMYKFKNL